MRVIKKISFIGAGNVAWHMAQAFKTAGFDIVQVFSRSKESSKLLADKVNAQSINVIKDLNNNADLYIISVPDQAISPLAEVLPVRGKTIVHTSGSVDINVLKSTDNHYGVFYPLQTFSKSILLDFQGVPVCIEGDVPETVEALTDIARKITEDVREINSLQRKTLHLAAVFACNFPNFMYSIAGKLLKEQRLPFELLRPLINETARKTSLVEPAALQTGPAVREDFETIEKHLQMLQDAPDFYEIYNLITQNIIRYKQVDKEQ